MNPITPVQLHILPTHCSGLESQAGGAPLALVRIVRRGPKTRTRSVREGGCQRSLHRASPDTWSTRWGTYINQLHGSCKSSRGSLYGTCNSKSHILRYLLIPLFLLIRRGGTHSHNGVGGRLLASSPQAPPFRFIITKRDVRFNHLLSDHDRPLFPTYVFGFPFLSFFTQSGGTHSHT